MCATIRSSRSFIFFCLKNSRFSFLIFFLRKGFTIVLCFHFVIFYLAPKYIYLFIVSIVIKPFTTDMYTFSIFKKIYLSYYLKNVILLLHFGVFPVMFAFLAIWNISSFSYFVCKYLRFTFSISSSSVVLCSHIQPWILDLARGSMINVLEQGVTNERCQ